MINQLRKCVSLSYKARSICRMSIPALFFVLFFQVLRGQGFSDLDNIVEQQKKVFGGKMAVMVWKDTVLYQKAVGEDVTVNTQMPIGCAGAWLTAALTMTFVDQGKISLDDPVAKYLPIYEKYAKAYLTIRHCLTNMTGLEGEKGGVEKMFQKTKYETLEDQVNSFASGREIIENPGKLYNYNNIGTNIVGRVLEVVGKKSFDRLMQERIFRPLSMKKSTYSSETAVNPFSGGVSSAADFTKFLSMLLNKGTLNGKKVLSEASVAEVSKIQTSVVLSPGMQGIYAYINQSKKYSAVVFGEPKEKKEKEDKSRAVYKQVNDLLEQKL